MKFQGKLVLNKKCEYGMFSGGNYTNISELLNLMLTDKIYAKVKVGQETVFDAKGKLYLLRQEDKMKSGILRQIHNYNQDQKRSYLYKYEVDEKSLDDVLWENVGNVITLWMGSAVDDDNKVSTGKAS